MLFVTYLQLNGTAYRSVFASDRNLSTSREVWLPEAAPHVLVVYVPAIVSRYMYNALLD